MADLPDLSTARARLEFARQQDAVIPHRYAHTPVILIAELQQVCDRCGFLIVPGDPIASWRTGSGWAHAACLICRACGEWVSPDGACHGRG